jgi:DNA-binding transcriptional ArsR family regulator
MVEDVFIAIADPTRRQILQMLAQRPLPVKEMAARFPVSRPAISKHLRVLRNAGLVYEKAQGRQHYYQLKAERLREVRDWVNYFDSFWQEKLLNLKKHVEKKP